MRGNIISYVSSSIGRDSTLIRTLRPVYEAMLECAHFGRGIPYTLNGLEYRVAAKARPALKTEFDPEVAAFLKANLGPQDVVLDVGAQIGIYALQFAHWTKGPPERSSRLSRALRR